MLNVALLGFGRIGQMHAENIKNHNKLNLLYICEKDSKLAKKAKLKFKCKVVKNYKTLFEDNMVDIIFISSSTSTHINFIKHSLFRTSEITYRLGQLAIFWTVLGTFVCLVFP